MRNHFCYLFIVFYILINFGEIQPQVKTRSAKLSNEAAAINHKNPNPSFEDVIKIHKKDVVLPAIPTNNQSSSVHNKPALVNVDKKIKEAGVLKEIAFPSFESAILKYKKTKNNSLNNKIIRKGLSSDSLITFPDANLSLAICQALNCTTSELTVSRLSELYYLYAEYKDIQDLSGLENCNNLRTLYLGGNNISDLSPLSNLTNMVDLSIAFNKGTINDFSFFDSLSNMQSLDLMSANISQIDFITKLPNIQILRLEDNPISDFSPISGLNSLTMLFLRNTQLSDLSLLVGKDNLTNLDLRKTKINDISVLSGLSNLAYLYLGENEISDISSISGLRELIYLELSNLNIDSQDIQFLSYENKLKYLVLEYNQITDIRCLSGNSSLTQLFLQGNPINDFTPLSTIVNLEYLEVTHTGFSDLSIIYSLEKLSILSAQYDNITDITPLFNLPSLTILALNGNPLSNRTILIDLPVLINKGIITSNPGPRWLEVLSPNTSTPTKPGYQSEIVWKNQDCNFDCIAGASKVNIDYSIDFGNTWNSIVQNTENDGTYEWIVPDVTSTLCFIKVSDAEVPDSVYASGPLFSIPQSFESVSFPDPGLEAKIRESLGGFTGDLTIEKLKEVTYLQAYSAGISDLTGIQYCTNLQSAGFCDNNIVDVSLLKGLQYLWAVDISRNPITVIPDSIFQNITSFNCGYSGITDFSFLQAMTNLTTLYMDGITIDNPSFLQNLRGLNILSLINCGISDISFCRELPSLNMLMISDNNISDLSAISNLSLLTSFDGSRNPVANIPDLTNLINLNQLVLNGLHITDISFLKKIPQIESLYIGSNDISDILPLMSLPGLINLEIAYNPVENVNVVSNLKNLQMLFISDIKIQDLSFLTGLESLNTIMAENCNINDVHVLFELPSLVNVFLTSNPLSNKTIRTDISELIKKGIFVYCPSEMIPVITEPNYLSFVEAGKSFNIKWVNNYCDYNCGAGPDSVKLELSVDNGSTWQEIVSSTPNDSLYEWNVPNIASTSCLLRISDASYADLFDVSDTLFTITKLSNPDIQETLTNLLIEMKSFDSFANDKSKKDFEGIIKEYDKSLKNNLWLDGNHLAQNEGDKVLDLQGETVKDMVKWSGKYNSLITDPWVDIIVGNDKLLIDTILSEANNMITENCSGNGDKKCENAYKKLTKAQKEYNNAVQNITAGKYSEAINNFEDAWESLADIVYKIYHKTIADELNKIVVPESFTVSPNYPNPFNPSTTIRFGLPLESRVSLKIYNSIGQEVTCLINNLMDAGYHEVIFNASDYASGLYIYRLEAVTASGEKYLNTQKMILMK